MAKKLGSRHGGFNKLPDELVIRIFTKLSSSGDEKHHDSRADLKALVPCLYVSKRFNALACLVPTSLSIEYPSITMLYQYHRIILNKFKYIRSLQITHSSDVLSESIPASIMWGAAFRPHGYCFALVSYKGIFLRHVDPQDATLKDDKYHEPILRYIGGMIRLHHMLVSSIKDHRCLRRVMVTDSHNHGTLTLEEDMLAELRNCTTTNLEHVLVRDRLGYANELVVPENGFQVVLTDVCFCIIEWQDKVIDDGIQADEDVRGIPADIPQSLCQYKNFCLKYMLETLLKDPVKMEVNNHSKDVLQLVSYIKSDGNLPRDHY
ncbi:hypothetical protein POM88_014825 [Heracleum sosnowskyi]|uniref:F-box domain-containing protein n=1 Tax=Heracleum sosnowskyi TaxID=360622 RepID=A0AAD8IIY9_9APIA|nr:hypothetical protein POM88_014825 [Heracleum sosnowskyi]